MLSQMDAGREMERAKGFEPSAQNPQPAQPQISAQTPDPPYTQIRAQISGRPEPELNTVVEAWPGLSRPLKAAILAIVGASKAQKEGQP